MNAVVIEKCEIVSFGCISNTIITPSSGINLITAPNESGKTTLAHFIKFIFYGFSGQRVSNVSENEKKHYIPWDNPRAAGALEFSLGSVRYRIDREYLAGKDICTVTEKDTGKEILKGQVPGECFFGVKEEIFTKTAFFRQLSAPSKKDDELAEQLRNLVASADESVSASDAIKRLSDTRNRIRSRVKGGGILPALEEKRAHYDRALGEAVSRSGALGKVDGEIKEIEKSLADNRNAKNEIKKELDGIEKYEAFVKYEELKEHARKVTDAQSEYDTAVDPFGGKEPDKDAVAQSVKLISRRSVYVAKVDERKETYENAEKDVENARKESLFDGRNVITLRKKINAIRGARAFMSVLIVLMLLAAGATAVFSFTEIFPSVEFLPWQFIIVFGVGALAIGIVLLILNMSASHFATRNGFSSIAEMKYMLGQYPAAQQEIAELELKAFNAKTLYDRACQELANLDGEIFTVTAGMPGDESDVNKRVADIVAATDTVIRTRTQLETVKAVQEAAFSNCDLKKISEMAEGATPPAHTREELEKALELLASEDERSRSILREKEGERGRLIGSGGDPALIQAQRDAVAERIKYLEQAYAAVNIAAEALDEADKYMRNTVSPALSRHAGKYMSEVTDGKYGKVSFDTSLTMSYETVSGTKHSDYMSAGTRDSAYMCLRLALINLIYSETRPPLVLDDAFVRLDGERLENMLALVETVAGEGQVFVFSCHEREQQIFDSNGTKYNRIVI